ncbi:MAG: TetR/AcrR family transcriptional regulator [Oceanospirillaceae bacterium]|nr:TetR/AcrR family transcriptional regulator [Oceanospirillaceae bacterium]
MTKPLKNESGWRGSPEVWFEAAIEILLESGVEAVKISTLAKRLNLSRTSFYWFFNDREALLSDLVSAWKDKNTGGIVAQSEAYADSLAEATLNVFDCWLDETLFDSKFEFAIRSWSLRSQAIQEEVQRADTLRLSALANMFRRHGFNDIEADVHSRTIYLVQIGYITMQTRESVAERMRRIPEYVKIFTGELPQPHELKRFYHKHGYTQENV